MTHGPVTGPRPGVWGSLGYWNELCVVEAERRLHSWNNKLRFHWCPFYLNPFPARVVSYSKKLSHTYYCKENNESVYMELA